MRLESIRLKNIKSYGTGPDGNGVTITFQPGVNRVAGRNGHGKTTIIEALGYALFYSEPQHDETFKVHAYFLRAGEKEAEIDVVFAHAGETYRVERALGQSKRRSKLVQRSDESTCAEGDEAVASCLCRILRAEERTFSQRQLADLFSNLVGVKQGRLAWPFDSKPAAAKEFFEPLLDVAIFRESESRLREARSRFEDLLKEQELKLADVSARIEERASSRERMPVAEARVEDRRRALEKGRKLRDEAEKQKQGWEQKQIEFNTAKSALDEATYQLKLLIQKREQDERHFAESQTAAGGAQQAEAGYLAFLRAEERLRVLQQKQSERSAMRSQRDSAFQAKAEAELKVSAAKRQMTELTEERAGKSRQSETLRQQATDAAKKVADAKVECERSGQAVAVARHAWEELNRWLDSLPEKSEQIETLSQENLFAWDVRPALKARLEEARMAEELRKWDVKASQSEQARLSLAAQLTQIAGGVCPFLKEKCRQFDPKAVQKDISAFEKDVAAAVSRRQAASVELGRAKVHAAEARSRLLKQVQAKLDEARGHLDSRERERARAEQNLVNDQRNLEQAERALKELLSKGEQIDLATIRAGAELKAAAQRMAEWEDKLKQFASLEQELEQQQQAKEKHAKEHQVFLQNQPLAAKLGSFQAALTASRDAEARAAESVRWRAEKLEQAARDFDLEKLRRAQEAAAEAKSRFSSDERELETAQDELKKEKARLNQWKEACAERARIENEAGRQRAAMELSKAAAKILKNAAPAVAQHLCSRIAANAQRIFNQINQEPIELDWKAEPHYSLRIVPGHRRFAMLSGGEQTKLALAMTLAMIQEFSGLQFAVFDEPTYAVDSESRQKLADAILEAQKAAGLEQLLVVSHDDAFEGKIENVVMLRKTAAGTELVMAG